MIRREILPELAEFGYAPDPPVSMKVKRLLVGVAVNRATVPILEWLARIAPGQIARPIYERLYRYELRRGLKIWQERLEPTNGSSG
jgi:hypothetical protein